jgi:hypothetical protein
VSGPRFRFGGVGVGGALLTCSAVPTRVRFARGGGSAKSTARRLRGGVDGVTGGASTGRDGAAGSCSRSTRGARSMDGESRSGGELDVRAYGIRCVGGAGHGDDGVLAARRISDPCARRRLGDEIDGHAPSCVGELRSGVADAFSTWRAMPSAHRDTRSPRGEDETADTDVGDDSGDDDDSLRHAIGEHDGERPEFAVGNAAGLGEIGIWSSTSSGSTSRVGLRAGLLHVGGPKMSTGSSLTGETCSNSRLLQRHMSRVK